MYPTNVQGKKPYFQLNTFQQRGIMSHPQEVPSFHLTETSFQAKFTRGSRAQQL